MKILLTHEIFMPNFHGGGEKVAYELAKGLLDRDIEVKVVTTGDPGIKEFEGIETVRIPVNRYMMNLAVPWIWKHTKDCDIIQTLNYNAALPSLIAGKLRKVPTVCLVTGLWRDKWIKMRGPVNGRISKIVENIQLNRDYDRFIFLSKWSLSDGIELGIPKNKSDVIPPGIDLEKFTPKKKRDYVLFMARLAKQKGVYDLIEVARQMPDVNFKFVGRGEEDEKIRKMAPPNVEILNVTFKDGKRFLDLYSHAPIMCLPSYSETFGLVIVEAMASGCAIVSTVPLDYEGIQVEPGNIEQIKNAIRKLIGDKKLVKKMGKENVKKAQKYTWKNFVDKTIKTYEKVL